MMMTPVVASFAEVSILTTAFDANATIPWSRSARDDFVPAIPCFETFSEPNKPLRHAELVTMSGTAKITRRRLKAVPLWRKGAKDCKQKAAEELRTAERKLQARRARDAYVKQVEHRLANIKLEIDQLEERASNAKGTEQENLDQQIETLQAQHGAEHGC